MMRNRTPHLTRLTIALATALASTLLLAGCFASSTGGTADGQSEGQPDSQQGQDVDVDSSGGAEIPEGWPADLPLPDGAVVNSMTLDDIRSVTIAVASRDDAEAAIDDMVAAGYAERARETSDKGGVASLANGEYVVTITYLDADDGPVNLGVSVQPEA